MTAGTLPEMRIHCQKCHSIELTEVFEPFVVPNATIEPAPVFNLPSVSGTKGARGRARMVQAAAKPVCEPLGELEPALLDQ